MDRFGLLGCQEKALTTFDGRETAPLNATPELFLDSTGQPMKFYDAVVGGRSVGTPGTVKLLWETIVNTASWNGRA